MLHRLWVIRRSLHLLVPPSSKSKFQSKLVLELFRERSSFQIAQLYKLWECTWSGISHDLKTTKTRMRLRSKFILQQEGLTSSLNHSLALSAALIVKTIKPNRAIMGNRVVLGWKILVSETLFSASIEFSICVSCSYIRSCSFLRSESIFNYNIL